MAITYMYPARAEDLGKGHYWAIDEFSEGEVVLDLHVKRWDDDGSRWTRRRDGITQADYDANRTNDKHLVFGLPLYAPADGVVKSSWRNFPDNPVPGKKLPEVTGEGGATRRIFAGGNHVVIETDDGRVFTVAHMEKGTVPSSLCPFEDEFPSTLDKIGDFRVASLIAKSDRPRVSRGGFIGRVGNSGNSSGPHIHISTAPAVGETAVGASEPIHITGAWRQDYSETLPLDPTKWEGFAGTAITRTVGKSLILPGTPLRRGDATAGRVGQSVLHFVRSRRAVSALQDSDGDLKLIVWGLTPEGQLVRRGDAEAGGASQITIAEPRSDLAVTALRDADGLLRLISWRVETDGGLVRCGEAVAGAVSGVAMVSPHEGVVVTAVRDDAGDLKLIAWHVSSAGDFSRRGAASAGPIGDVALARADSASGVVTAVNDSDGNLKLIAWSVANDGNSISRRGSAEAGKVSAVTLTARGGDDQLMVTAVRDDADQLRLISWIVSDGGDAITRGGTATAGSVREVAIAGSRVQLHATVACRDGGGDLRLTSWRLSPDGRSIDRWGGALAGAAALVALAATNDSGRDYLLTSCADSDGNLKLIAWEGDL